MLPVPVLENILKVIISNPDILNNLPLDMPNINFPTMGGHVFWNNLAEYGGWRIQQNTLTKHCRILDPDDVRRAWGTISAMEKIFEKLSRSCQQG
ncbi:MAG: hypothetical protein LBQ56_05840 [Synergistaceae bacterium]|nr:hypothetical protein [Synergistaceae bacterium]